MVSGGRRGTVSCPCCDGPHEPGAPETFACHRCGSCCTHLTERWGSSKAPFTSLPGPGLYQLGTPGGLRMFSWEAKRFPEDRLEPMLVTADAARERLVAVAYELTEERCPHYEDDVGCTIYDDRPLVCQAYPLLVVQGSEGPEIAVSRPCPATVPVIAAASTARRPEPVLASAYPDEFAPALAVPAMLKVLGDVIDFCATAGVIEPVRGLEEDEVHAWRKQGAVLDLVDVVEEAGVLDRGRLRDRAERVVGQIHDRWANGDP